MLGGHCFGSCFVASSQRHHNNPLNGRQIILAQFWVKEVRSRNCSQIALPIGTISQSAGEWALSILENRIEKRFSKNIIVRPFQFHLTLSRPRVMFRLSRIFDRTGIVSV